MTGGTGGDTYVVDNAADRTVETNAIDRDRVVTKVNHTLAGNVENLILSGASATRGTGNGLSNMIVGTDADNRLDGGGGDDKLVGRAGHDALLGMDGNDRVFGLTGNDAALGGRGNDTIDGGVGRDILSGGAGADRFVFRSTGDTSVLNGSADLITDFSRADGDRVLLSLIDAKTVAGNQAFAFIGTAAFTAPGQIRAVHSGGETRILLNTDRDTASEAVVRVSGLQTVTADWFEL
jgi:serralysin